MLKRPKKIKLVLIVYWLLLAYTVAAIGWWFTELYMHNEHMTEFRIKDLNKTSVTYQVEYDVLLKNRNNNRAQFIGEGVLFLGVIIAGAIFIFVGIIKELRNSRDQQNFLMAISHELKTPIAVSKLNLETIQKRKLSEVQQENLIAKTLSETNRLATLCNNLLISYQIEGEGYQISKDKINLSQLLIEIINSFQIHFPNREIISNIEPNLNTIGDPFLLEIAVNNLLENAAKYSAKEKPITILLNRQIDKATISVKDEEIGRAHV